MSGKSGLGVWCAPCALALVAALVGCGGGGTEGGAGGIGGVATGGSGGRGGAAGTIGAAGSGGRGGGSGGGAAGATGSGGLGGHGGALGGSGGSGGAVAGSGGAGASGAGGAAGSGSAGAGGAGSGGAGGGAVGGSGGHGVGGSVGGAGSGGHGGVGGAGAVAGAGGGGGNAGNAGKAGTTGGVGGAGGQAGAGGSAGSAGGGPATSGIARVSVSSAGVEANNSSEHPSLSGDGQLVAFESYASNLVTGDTNGAGDVFVHNMQTGTTVRVSVDSSGVQGDGQSSYPSLSANGRFVAFESDATNLVAGDTNGSTDIFVHDLLTGTTQRATVDSTGVQANSASHLASISADGRFVAFESYASNLVGLDNNSVLDIFVHDFQTGATLLASVGTAGNKSINQNSVAPSISQDGRFVAFHSFANDLVGDTADTLANIFLRDLQNNTLKRVGTSPAGVVANGDCFYPSLSGDGTHVAFFSGATNLVSGAGFVTEIFERDLAAGTTVCASVDNTGTNVGVDGTFGGSVSMTGRWVAFFARGTNPLSGGNGTIDQAFVRDTQTGTTTCASQNSAGDYADASCINVTLSSDGRFVAFESMATNLVPGGVTNQFDVFVAPAH